MKNPVTRTRLEFTRDRIQHYSTELYACADCAHRYHPKVLSQPYLVQFGAVLIGVLLFVLFKTHAPAWLYAVLPLGILALLVRYRARDRRVATSGGPRTARYGDVVPACPECGSPSARKAA